MTKRDPLPDKETSVVGAPMRKPIIAPNHQVDVDRMVFVVVENAEYPAHRISTATFVARKAPAAW